eukprot:c23768_g1_i1 orf=291-983(+)
MLEGRDSPLGSNIPPIDDGRRENEEEEEGEKEEDSVLPRHTKVVVTGNNRTNSVLVGLHGVVKSAVGSRGWHWLVLTNGIEVKLQRNALSVIETPVGQDDEDEIGESASGETSIGDCSKSSKPPVRFLKVASAMPRSASSNEPAALKKPQHKRQHTSIESKPSALTRVDFNKLETAALRRYRRHFKLVEVGPNSSKERLVDAVRRHFTSVQLDELQVIAGFVQAAKRLKA